MKKELMKNLCKTMLVLIGFFFLTPTIIVAQGEKSRTIEETFSVTKGALVKVDHRNGEIHVRRSKNDKVVVQLHVNIEGKYEKDVETLMNSVELKDENGSSAQVVLVTKSIIKNWKKINGKSTISLDNGIKLKGIKRVEVDIDIAVPDGINLEVSNKYNNITLENINADVVVYNYDGNVLSSDIDGDFSLNLKYGSATIGNVKNADMMLYESTLTMGNALDFKLNTKYSKHTIGTLSSADIESYEGDFTITDIKGDIEIKDKYSEWTVNSFKNGKVELYESEWSIGSLNNLELSSKFGEFNIGQAKDIDFEKSYEDELNIGTLETINCRSSKYFDANIENLKKGFYLLQDFNGDVKINKVASTFEGAEINGKNTDVDLPLDNLKYQLEVDVKNGDISLEEDDLETGFVSEKNSQLQIKGKMNKAKDSSPKVVIKGYNVDVELD